MKKNKTVKYSFRLTEEENRKFMEMLTLAECEHNKSTFIIKRIFDLPLNVNKVDVGTMKFYGSLNYFVGQFKRWANNYNQTTKILNTHLADEQLHETLKEYSLQTKHLIETCSQILKLTKEFNQKWLPK